MLGLFRYFLFASAASLLFHPYLARANWPVARYTNGTVGLINDGGEVHVQSAKLQVNGHLKVEGDLIVNSSNVALELTNLKPPKCMPPGGDKLQFDGMNWICVCNGAWTGPTCEQPPSPPPPAPPPQPTVPPPDQSKLSFSVSANFQGSSKDPPCPDEFPFWVSCKIPPASYTSGWSGTRNDNCNWGSQFRNWAEIEAAYNSYESGDLMGCGGHQYGYPTSIKSYYESINILAVMKVQYDELVAGGLVPVATPVTINGKQLYQDADGWILLVAYKHNTGENTALVPKTAPLSPTEGYSHIWLEDLGLTASDVDSVKFYCKTAAHSRVMHFSSSTDLVKYAIVTGAYTGNVVSYWNSGTTKFDDHTANLPDSTTEIWGASDLMNFPFYGGGNHWAIKTNYWSRSGFFCDDGGPTHADVDTLHQIWFKRKSSGNR